MVFILDLFSTMGQFSFCLVYIYHFKLEVSRLVFVQVEKTCHRCYLYLCLKRFVSCECRLRCHHDQTSQSRRVQHYTRYIDIYLDKQTPWHKCVKYDPQTDYTEQLHVKLTPHSKGDILISRTINLCSILNKTYVIIHQLYNVVNILTFSLSFPIITVDLGCNEVKGSELKFRYNQGFVTDKVLYNMYN